MTTACRLEVNSRRNKIGRHQCPSFCERNCCQHARTRNMDVPFSGGRDRASDSSRIHQRASGCVLAGGCGLFRCGVDCRNWPYLFRKSQASVIPDTPISAAIDYIVNDSIAILRQPPQPYIKSDRRIVHWGVQHSDALAAVNEKLNTGALDASGFRQIKSHIANQFEQQRRLIPVSDWLISQLHPLTSLSNTDKAPQTMAIPGTHAPERLEWTGIMVPMATVKQLWPQQSSARRAWKWIVRRPRIEPRAPNGARSVKSKRTGT
jgi:hypothetical protein